ncbi:MAG: GTP 3',8-cyclase MoaA [Lachnospiraceae bacterium]|jgi:molybdenum cofactor biosynthesis protein A|nr:GTP 3',8-cyclase MoaA [Lachnospiraceae bacterium]MCI9469722.1 GTP 3',8-cyclase MoaA [Lachnospiraceae bacterium]
MTDKYGRIIDYMRVSIIDRCNLRCQYCMPTDIKWIPPQEILSLEEITEICRQASQIGIKKIKVTGGEPLIRKGCVDLIRMLKEIPGIEQVTLTTNGVLLAQYAEQLNNAGLDAINVSLDTLDPEKYLKITQSDALADVLDGISAIEKYDIPLKINSVLQRGVNDSDWQELIGLAKDRRIDVRFIEMMPIGHGKQFDPISNAEILQKLREHYGAVEEVEKVRGNGPATYCHIPAFTGNIGFISAIHGKFCSACNRIRLTSTGQIKPCLCYEDHISLKEAVRSGRTDEIQKLLLSAIDRKPDGHRFDESEMITEKHEMAQIGG